MAAEVPTVSRSLSFFLAKRIKLKMVSVTVRKMMEGISETQSDKCPKKEEKQLLAACDAD